MLRSPLDALACSIYPTSCALCGSPLPHFSLAPICDACWTEVPVLAGSACARCGDALDSPIEALCRACRMAPPAFERAVAYGLYDGRMRDAIRAFKFDGIRPAAARLGSMLAQAIASLHGQAPAELLVVPIPLHRSRQSQRGFNQARLLAEHALRVLAQSHPEWRLALAGSALLRVRATASMAELTPRQRRLNLRGAFAVSDSGTVQGRHILLVDDIMTTGATVRAASRALVDAGAASVWVATLSRARRVNPLLRAALQDVPDQPDLPSNADFVRWQAAPENSLHDHSSFLS